MTMAAAFFLLPVLLIAILSPPTSSQHPPSILTIVNNCPFTICPAIAPNAGHEVLERGGFCLPTLSHRSFSAPATHWSGRIWARTGCTNSGAGFSCATGGCGNRLECAGLGGAAPATLAQLTLHHGGLRDLVSYSVSLVDGFNLPMTITPHEGRGLCPVVGCRENLLSTCPPALQFRVPAGAGPVVGCKSGCEAYGTDQLCCRNAFNSPTTCRASSYSNFFKNLCPATFTYAQDSPSLTHECEGPKELKVIFCH